MSSISPNPQSHNERRAIEQVLREALRQDLQVFLEADVHTAAYVVAWISFHCRLEEIEALVDELDDVYTRAGRSLLTGKPKKK